MPSTYAHAVFGELVFSRYSETLQKTVCAHRDLFSIGLHGPDLLFYYHPLSHNAINSIGYNLHDEPAATFFGPAATLVRGGPENLFAAREAYLLGFLCHFALDSACHSYIERKIQVSGVSHSELETEFDRSLMVERGLDPLRFLATGHLHTSAFSAQIIAPFFPSVTPKQVDKALRSMLFYHKLLRAPHSFKRNFIKGILRLSGHYESMHGMLVNPSPNPACADSNLRLKKLMHKAVDTCLQLTDAYLPCLTAEHPLPEALNATFGPNETYREIPILSVEEESHYAV